MNDLEYFSIVGDRAEFRPRGEVSITQGVVLVTKAISRTRELGIRHLLVDITALTGFESPGVATRYHIVHQWAEAARGAVRVVMVSRPEWIDPEKFGVMAASNIGFQCEIFTTEEEALRWLEGRPADVTPAAPDPSSPAEK